MKIAHEFFALAECEKFREFEKLCFSCRDFLGPTIL